MVPTERRGEPRLELLGLWGTTGPGGECRIVDVAPHGLGIETVARPQIGRACTVLLRSVAVVTALRGAVVWARLSRCEAGGAGTRPVYRAGVRLHPGSALADGLLDRLVEAHALLVPPTAMAGVIPPQETLHVSIPEAIPFEILRFGPRGVRIAAPFQGPVRGEISLELVLHRSTRATRARVVRSLPHREGRELDLELLDDEELSRELLLLARAAAGGGAGRVGSGGA